MKKNKSRVGVPVFALALLLATQTAFARYELGVNFKISPPPAAGSTEAHADYTELLRFQDTRTKEECRAAESQSTMSLDSFFGPQAGLLTESELTAVEELLTEIKETVSAEAKPLKESYARARPYDVDHTLKPCIRKPGGATSYPSSHAAVGIVMGKVLADLLPASRIEFEDQGIQIGTNRALGGVHHPSDIEAGQDLGEKIYEALRSNSKFKADFSKTKRALH